MYSKFKRLVTTFSNMHKIAKTEFKDDTLTVIFDFTYKHYALGDTLTELAQILCYCDENKIANVDIYLFVNPDYPAAISQGFITNENYYLHLTNLLPAFSCIPNLRSLHVLRDIIHASYIRLLAHRSGSPTWPPYSSQVKKTVTYPISHKALNEFFVRNKYLPKLCHPKGYKDWANSFISKHFLNQKVVVINPRQSKLTTAPTVVYRDADLNDWYDFLLNCAKTHKDVTFIQVGGFSEWEYRLQSLPNVFIPRKHGLGLAHELALLCSSNMFIGTSSGFATMATFTDVPYLICNIEHFFAAFAGVEVGATHYPFAHEHQTLLWEREEPSLMSAHLIKVLKSK